MRTSDVVRRQLLPILTSRQQLSTVRTGAKLALNWSLYGREPGISLQVYDCLVFNLEQAQPAYSSMLLRGAAARHRIPRLARSVECCLSAFLIRLALNAPRSLDGSPPHRNESCCIGTLVKPYACLFGLVTTFLNCKFAHSTSPDWGRITTVAAGSGTLLGKPDIHTIDVRTRSKTLYWQGFAFTMVACVATPVLEYQAAFSPPSRLSEPRIAPPRYSVRR